MLDFDQTRRADRQEYSDLHKLADRLLDLLSNQHSGIVYFADPGELADYNASYDKLAAWLHRHCRDCGCEVEPGDLWCGPCVMARLE